MTDSSQDAMILSELIPCKVPGKFIGRITLNTPRTLNSLSLEMIVSMREILHNWERDARVAMLFIDGCGEKAFCAGGDVKRIHGFIAHARASGADPVALCQVFFENEYRLDFAIHRYPKPIVVWGDGIVMGGGIGIMNGASHRIVTETTMMAMPEITIGLYPDVAASYFLPKMPGRIGLFLAITAARVNGADALFVGLADHYMPRAFKEKMLDALRSIRLDSGLADEITRVLSAHKVPDSPLKGRQKEIDSWMAGDDIETIYDRFQAMEPREDDKLLIAARQTMLGGSPSSLKIAFEQYRRSKGISLKAAFEQELVMSIQCCLHPDFPEGVRALLVDKDNAPKWSPATVGEVSQALVNEHFKAPWPHENPLSDL